MNWQYGVTTVPTRFNELLPRTLQSIAIGGFPSPRIFVDGAGTIPEYLRNYEVTQRVPALGTFGSWILAAWELYIRNPNADRYAIFQDDLVTYPNLRDYLDQCEIPAKGYWNLYTFPQNEQSTRGWYLSNQLGKGAVALMFSNEGLRTILAQQHIVDRPLDAKRGKVGIDGGVVSAYRKIGWQEYVHNPSLVQHTGHVSSMGHKQYPQAGTFKGESFDARELIQCATA